MPELNAGLEIGRRRGTTFNRSKRLDLVLEVPVTAINLEDRRFQFRIGSSISDVESSIRALGQQVPVTLWGREPYTIIDGFRRLRALTALQSSTVKAILRDDLDEQGAYQLSFIENVKRRSWTPLEKSLAVRVAVVDRGMPLKQVAHELSLSERQVQRYLQLAEFDPRLANALSQGRISMAHAAILHRAGRDKLDDFLALAERIPVEALRRRLRVRRHLRAQAYVSVGGDGFTMTRFRFTPAISSSEKERMLAALERAAEIVRTSLA